MRGATPPAPPRDYVQALFDTYADDFQGHLTGALRFTTEDTQVRAEFRMSTRLVNEGLLTRESRDALKAQALGGIPVAVLGSIPVFLLGEDPGEDVAILLLLGLVAAVGYRTARFSARPIRALGYSIVVVLIVFGVVTFKLLVGH